MVRFAPVPPVVAAKGIYSRPASFYPAEAQGAELANNYQMPHADALHLGCLGVVINRRLVRHRKEHIAKTRRAFLTEKCRALGSFGKLHRVGRGQQMFHLV